MSEVVESLSLWKMSKETSPLANGLSEQQPLKKTSLPLDLGELRNELRAEIRNELRKDASRHRLEQLKDCSVHREKSKPREPSKENELLRRVEQLLDERSQKEMCKVEDMISAAIVRFGEAFTAQMEAMRQDLVRVQSGASNCEGPPRIDCSENSIAGSEGGIPVSLRSALDEQRLAAEAQISGLCARVNAMQKSLAELLVQQELHHIATGKFACTVSEFSSQDREASLQALNAQEAAAKDRLRRLRKPPKTPPGPSQNSGGRTPNSAHDDRASAVSSSSGASVATTLPASLPHVHTVGRKGIIEEQDDDDTVLVELLPVDRSPSLPVTRTKTAP